MTRCMVLCVMVLAVLRPALAALGKRSLALVILVALVFGPAEVAWPAEKLVPGLFKNRNELIGWLKAKGKCDGTGGVVSCKADIQLSTKDREGKEVSPGWRMQGFWSLIESSSFQSLFARINRFRQFALSPKDPLASVSVENASFHEFGPDGIKLQSYQTVWMKNYNGENILSLTVPWPKGSGPLEIMSEDFFLLGNDFGVGWNFISSERP